MVILKMCWVHRRANVIYLFLISFALQAQLDTVLIFEHFNKTNSCPFNEAYNAIPDRNDHIWIGTNSGLYRFDGLTFKRIEFDSKLAYHKTIPYTIDSNQNIYFGIEDVGLGIYNLLDQEFNLLSSIKNDSTTLNSNIIDGLIVDNSNNAWIIFENNGFCKLDLTNYKIKRIYPRNEIFDSDCQRLNSLTVLYLDPCDSDVLWLGANYGILKYQISTGKLTAYNNCDFVSGKIPVKCLTRKNCQELMIGSWHKPLIIFNTISEEFKLFDETSTFDNISKIIPLENGNFLFSDSDKGIGIYKSSKNILVPISSTFNSKSLDVDVKRAMPNIYNLFKSKECYWATSPTHGLSRFNFENYRKSYFTGYPANLISYLGNNSIITVDARGIRIIDKKKFTLDSILFSKKFHDLPNFELVDIESKNDTAFILTTKSLFWFHNGKLKSLIESDNHSHDFLSFHFFNNKIYIGTRRNGVIVLNNPINNLPHSPLDIKRYDHRIPYIRSIATDTSGNFWFATKIGLFYSPNNNEEIFSYELKFDNDDNRTITRIEKLHFDIENNRLWFIATGMGLSYISLDFNSKKGIEEFLFIGQQILDIKSDKNKSIWVLTENSLAVLDNENDEIPYFLPWYGNLSNDDLKALDFVNNQEILVGCLEGFEFRNLNFRPKKEFKVFFDELEINGEPIQFTSSIHDLEENQNNLKVVINSTGTFGKKNISYKSKLEGYENNWSLLEQANSIFYKNLEPGNYALIINSNGLIENQEGKEQIWRFRINEDWINTIYFKILIAFICFSLISYFLYLKFREKEVIISKEKALNEQRNRIAKEMHDDLGGGLTVIKYLSQGMLNKINDLEQQEKLSKIINHSNNLVTNMNEIIWALHGDDELLLNLIAYCRRYSIEYLADHNLNLDFKMEEGLDGNIVFSGIKRRQIFLVYKEILHNIVKHSNANKVSIKWALFDNSLSLMIHDDGIGFQVDNNKRFVGRGNGIRNIQLRIKQIGGLVNWECANGTLVRIIIPVTF